jgi:mono/diheme cytochrome c family protein
MKPMASGNHRVRRYALRGLAALAIIVVAAVAGVWGAAQWRLTAQYEAPLVALKVQPSPDLVAEGERVFHIFGCAGCHHEAGNVLFEAPNVGRLVAPNISRRLADYTDEQLVRLVRHGVKHNGTTAIVMPASVLGRISDQDLAALISYLRSLSPRPDAVTVGTQWGPLGYIALAAGKVELSADIAPVDEPPVTRPEGREGEYLVSATCRACHELDGIHDNGFGMVTPPVRAMVRSYSLEDFRHLLRTGEGSGGRQLGLMSEVARSDFSHFTDGEIDAIHRYLNAP